MVGGEAIVLDAGTMMCALSRAGPPHEDYTRAAR
jgi:hypothetical protein